MSRRELREQIFKLLFRVEFNSLEDMPALVRRYFTDREFMHVQKENCRRAAEANLNVDNGEAFQRIHDAVKKLSS